MLPTYSNPAAWYGSKMFCASKWNVVLWNKQQQQQHGGQSCITTSGVIFDANIHILMKTWFFSECHQTENCDSSNMCITSIIIWSCKQSSGLYSNKPADYNQHRGPGKRRIWEMSIPMQMRLWNDISSLHLHWSNHVLLINLRKNGGKLTCVAKLLCIFTSTEEEGGLHRPPLCFYRVPECINLNVASFSISSTYCGGGWGKKFWL